MRMQNRYNSTNLKAEDELGFLKQQARAISLKLERINQAIAKKGEAKSLKITAFVDEGECDGCGACRDVCPSGAISIKTIAKIDNHKCTGCLACVKECPKGAIAVKYL